jgi:hypothetical protein
MLRGWAGYLAGKNKSSGKRRRITVEPKKEIFQLAGELKGILESSDLNLPPFLQRDTGAVFVALAVLKAKDDVVKAITEACEAIKEKQA